MINQLLIQLNLCTNSHNTMVWCLYCIDVGPLITFLILHFSKRAALDSHLEEWCLFFAFVSSLPLVPLFFFKTKKIVWRYKGAIPFNEPIMHKKVRRNDDNIYIEWSQWSSDLAIHHLSLNSQLEDDDAISFYMSLVHISILSCLLLNQELWNMAS